MKRIELTNGQVALVDDGDFDLVSGYRWHASKCRRVSYAQASARRGDKTQIQMHRLILGVADGIAVDHVDSDGLNNQRANLRVATLQQNGMNARKRLAATTSKFKGVRWHKQHLKWQAYITNGGKQTHLGLFESERSAAFAYNREAIKRFGSFARINEL